MRIGIVGLSGMLGREVLIATNQHPEHTAVPLVMRRTDPHDPGPIALALAETQVEVLINCVGAIPLSSMSYDNMIEANVRIPWVLDEAVSRAGIRMVHVSTDCVFTGHRAAGRPYSSVDAAAPIDLYGRTKLAGEVPSLAVTNVRTSFIGPAHGLWKWFVEHDGSDTAAEGWRNAWWSGSTVDAVARALVDIAAGPPVQNVVHLATEHPVSKFDVLLHLKRILDLTVLLIPVEEPRINRALMPDVELLEIDTAIELLAEREAACA